MYVAFIYIYHNNVLKLKLAHCQLYITYAPQSKRAKRVAADTRLWSGCNAAGDWPPAERLSAAEHSLLLQQGIFFIGGSLDSKPKEHFPLGEQ